MKGNKEVINYLNQLLAGELMARDQYFIHSRMYEDWGYKKLYDRIDGEMTDETGHAHQLIHRILMLDGIPDMVPGKLNIGKDVPSMLQSDLEIELSVRDNLKKGVALCEKYQDYVSRQILVEQLVDTEEDHAHWLEQQLRLINEIGLKNYLQSVSE